MKRRCLDPKRNSYKSYGGRGIKVCDRWLKFDNFIDDMGERPDEMTLDRINNDGNYEPANCKWSTAFEQCNNKRNSRLIEFNNKTQALGKWCLELGLDYRLVSQRMGHGWSVERAFNTK